MKPSNKNVRTQELRPLLGTSKRAEAPIPDTTQNNLDAAQNNNTHFFTNVWYALPRNWTLAYERYQAERKCLNDLINVINEKMNEAENETNNLSNNWDNLTPKARKTSLKEIYKKIERICIADSTHCLLTFESSIKLVKLEENYNNLVNKLPKNKARKP